MAKDSFWFKHDYNARNDEKILELRSELGAEAYGIFWMLIETMAENENGGVKASLIGGLSHGFGVTKDRLKSIIAFCLSVNLLFEKDGIYFSNRLLRHKEDRKFLSEKGKEGANKKWGGYREGNADKIREEKKRIIGVEFLPNNIVKLADGTFQHLGDSQKLRVLHEDIQPHEIEKGKIY